MERAQEKKKACAWQIDLRLNDSSSLLLDILPEKKEKMTQGAICRSHKLPLISNKALQQKVVKVMAELGIRKFELDCVDVMATRLFIKNMQPSVPICLPRKSWQSTIS